MATSTSFPSFKTRAVEGINFMSFPIASDVFCLERDSKYLPKEINVKIIPADSK